MPAEQLSNPFGVEPVEEIPLTDTPLVKALTQVRFPGLVRLRDESAIGELASLLGQEYPLLHEERGINLLITPTGLTQQQAGQRIWRLGSRDERWKISISENFLSLETTNYSDRREFVDRFSDAINRLIEVIYPPYVERLGVRYMNRVSDQTLIQNQLASMIRSEMLGGLATERPAHVELRHSISDSLFVDDEYAIQLRCGILPARAVLDTDIPPLENPVWILDIDSYREQKMGVDSDELTQELQFLADRAYRMFRWVVNADFIEHFK